MSMIVQPEPDRRILARRDAIVGDLVRLLGRDVVIADDRRPPRLRNGWPDGLSRDAACGRAAAIDRGSFQGSALLP